MVWAPWKPNQISISSLHFINPKNYHFCVKKYTVFWIVFEKMPIFHDDRLMCNRSNNSRAYDIRWFQEKFLETIKLCTKNTFHKIKVLNIKICRIRWFQMISNHFWPRNDTMTEILQNYKWLQTTLHTIKIREKFEKIFCNKLEFEILNYSRR